MTVHCSMVRFFPCKSGGERYRATWVVAHKISVFDKVWQLYFMLSFLKRANEEKCKVKVLPWQQFLSEFAENCREVMLDLYEDIVKV